ncbi:hypothetical protein N2152v2_008341 [Parachlorella kessleri]
MDLLSCLESRDFAGALTALRFTPGLGKEAQQQWRAFLHFHAGRYEEALELYVSLSGESAKSFDLHQAACLFRLRRYAEAQQAAERGPDCQLKVRLLLHCAAKLGGPSADLEELTAGLGSNVDDQVSLAAVHYGRNHYQAAADVYTSLLKEHQDLHALHVYLALCYYMLDDWQSCQGHLEAYKEVHADSVLAANVCACNGFRERDAEAARASLRTVSQAAQSSALIRHNMVVFNDGLGGMQVLPPLVDVIPEARLNLVIYYLRRGDAARALNLIKDLEPTTAFEYISKGVVCSMLAQQGGSPDLSLEAQRCLDAVGASETECDTVPGRQCAASSLLLRGEFDEALPFLESIAEFCSGEDAYNWNLGMARAAVGQYGGALEALSRVQRQDWAQEPGYVAWLARCYIMTGQAELAWQLYLQQQQAGGPVVEILQLIANDCYKAGVWLWAARAFDALEYLNPAQPAMSTAVWEGKRGACVAVFQQAAKGEQPPEVLRVVTKWVKGSGADVDVIV